MNQKAAEIRQSGKIFYGWVIVAAAFTVTMVCAGTVYSFGVFLGPLREYFGATAAVISGAYSFTILTNTTCGILAGWGVDRYGPKSTIMIGGFFLGSGLLLTSLVGEVWQLYLTYGLIGVGMSTVYAPIMTTVTRWFSRRRGLALGIITMGTGVGPFISAPLASYLIVAGSWQFAYRVLACMAGLAIVASFFLKRSPEEIGELPDGERNPPDPGRQTDPGQQKPVRRRTALPGGGFSLKEALGREAFWLFAGISFMIGLAIQTVLAHIVAYSAGTGISSLAAAAVLSTIMGVSVIGRIILGTASDAVGRRGVLAISLFGEGLMMLCFTTASQPWMLFLFAAVFGFCYGGHVPQIPALIGDILGLAHMGMVLGVINFFWGVGGAIGPFIAGYLVDVTGSYASALIMGGMAMLVAGGLTLRIKKF